MIKRFSVLTALILAGFSISGCSSKHPAYPNPDSDIKQQIEKNKFSASQKFEGQQVLPYQQRVSLMVESRSNESKVVVNAGKVLKIFIAPYKRRGTLIAGHDIYTYVEKPGFVVGNSVPPRSTDGLITPNGSLPFYVDRSKLNIDADRAEMTNREVKDFNNNLYKREYGFNKTVPKKIEEHIIKRDAALKKYLKSLKKDHKEEK